MPTLGEHYNASDEWDDTIVTASLKYEVSSSNVYMSITQKDLDQRLQYSLIRDQERQHSHLKAQTRSVGSKNEFFDGRLQVNLAWYELSLRDSNSARLFLFHGIYSRDNNDYQ